MPLRLWGLLPLALVLLALVLLAPFQMGSLFGRADAADGCPAPVTEWAGLPPPPVQAAGRPLLRAVTYNLHSGLGPDWRLFAGRSVVESNLDAIARRIAAAAPAGSPVDVVGLNEVDFGSRRSGWFDQAAFLAERLHRLTGYSYRIVSGQTWQRSVPGLEVRFGNALLVRHPVVAQAACRLGGGCGPAPLEAGGGWLERFVGETRGVVSARISFHGEPIDLFLTHLEAVVLAQRETQAAELLGMVERAPAAVLLLGDINAVPSAMTAVRRHLAADRTHDILTSGRLIDARVFRAAAEGEHGLERWATYPAERPRWPLDVVFASGELMPEAVEVVGGRESDHRGLAVAYRSLRPAGARALTAWHDRLRHRQLGRIMTCDIGPVAAAPERFLRLRTATGFDQPVP